MKLLSFFALVSFLSTTTAFAPPTKAEVRKTSSSALRESKSPFDVLSQLGQQLQKEAGSLFIPKKAPAEPEKPEIPDVVIDPDYKLGSIFLVGGILLDLIPYIQFTLGPIVTLLGILFVVQTSRIRFCFDSTAFELRTSDEDESGVLKRTGENIVVGDANRWDYKSFVNYEFFPEGWIDRPQGPVLVYFKETQTPKEKWDEGPGKGANSPEAIAKGAKPGQVHFFPALCDCRQLRAEFERRGCAKM